MGACVRIVESPCRECRSLTARVQIEELIEDEEELSELPINGAPDDALNNTTYPQEGEEDLKNNSGDDEEEKSHYEWDEPEYKANFVRFINEEPIIDTMIRVAAGTIDKTVESVYNHHARIKERSRPSR